jgi:L-ascorbate metabolism protein UlaG (beta-lactamase superfamily)
MNIQYYGHSCFKITTKPAGRATEDIVFFIDPFDKSIGLRPPQGQADIIFVTHSHADHSNVSALKGDPVIINTPGEYSVKGINVIGLDSFHDDKEGTLRGHNTIFVFKTEDLTICHMGDIGADLSPKQIEDLGEIDILLIPVGGKYTIDGAKAVEIARKIEPSIIIPMHYKVKGTTADISDEKKFCSEIGNCPSNQVSKLSLKKKELEGKSMETILMSIE